ncbi:hypothetical protein [Bradyrhizobium sp. Ai1a-2]|uniref:hypothetical protein n=1 Tax=Bradyrhizobium sp. Ai1a-2 TaxID=196490 RepID=UPI0004252EC3|nr:hypothetical protein [Bradyrhizobium sp. Ai1a-2]
MARFIARFYKRVLGENGQVGDICQCTVDLDVPDNAQAVDVAKQKFCEMHGVHDWTLHADRLEVKQADFPS